MRGPGPRIVSILCLGLAVCAGAGQTASAHAQAAAASTAEPTQAPASPPSAAQAPATAPAGGAQAPATSTAATPANGQSTPPAPAASAAPAPPSTDQGTTIPPTAPATAPAVPATPPAAPATPPAAPTTTPAPPSQGTAAPQGTTTPSGSSTKKSKGKTKDTGKPGKPAKPVKPPPPPPKPPLPNKELLRLKPFTGSWTCVGRTYGPGPEHPTAGTMTFTWQSDGFWLEARYDELRGVATNTVPVSSVALWVFDDLQAGVSSLSVDNIGGSATQLAPGWQGEKLIFEGPGHRFGTQFVDRDIYVLHGDGQFLHTQEANVNENWIKLHDDTCTRTTAK